GTIALASRVDIGSPSPNSIFMGYVNISADGRYVSFATTSNNLVEGVEVSSGVPSIYVKDMETGELKVVVANAGFLFQMDMSDDGKFIAFRTSNNSIVLNDTNAADDIFVVNVQTGAIVRASVDSNGQQLLGNSVDPSISADGRYVAFAYPSSD